jgi:hypothetical protein
MGSFVFLDDKSVVFVAGGTLDLAEGFSSACEVPFNAVFLEAHAEQ